MASSISQNAINELTNFLSNFAKPELDNRKKIENLSFDTAKSYFFENMKERRLAEETIGFYNSQLRSFEKYLILIKKKNTINELTESEIKYYLNNKYSKHNVYTQNCHIRAIRAFFNYLEKDGYITANPVSHLKVLKQPKQKIDYLSIDQIRKLLTSFDLRKKSEIRNLLVIMLLLDTGVRIKELCNIKIEDIDFANRSIYIYATKTHTFRTVYYSKETERILNIYRNEILRSKENGPLLLKFHAYLDIPLDEALPKERAQNWINKKGKKLFGKDFRLHPHKFRHTFATHYIINGGDPFSLKDLLGHTNIETTNIYVDMTQKDLKIKHKEHGIFASVSSVEQKTGVPNED